MKLRRIAAMLLAGVMAVSLVGCGGSSSGKSDDKESVTTGSAVDSGSGERTKLTVGFDAEFPPYGFKDGDTYSGFDLDLAQAVCDYYGWELVKQPIDWDSKDMELSSGTIDCIWNGFTINGREDDYTWSEPYIDNSQVVVVKKDSGIASMDDLSGKIMDVQADSSALAALEGEDATDVGKKVSSSLGQLIQVSNYNTAFMDLEGGACDAIAMDIGVGEYNIKTKNATDKFQILKESITSEKYGIGFKLGNTALKDQVQSTLDEMFADGTVSKIAAKYGISEDALI